MRNSARLLTAAAVMLLACAIPAIVQAQAPSQPSSPPPAAPPPPGGPGAPGSPHGAPPGSRPGAPPGRSALPTAPGDSAAAVSAAADTLQRPLLSGVWVLDEKASQDPRPAFIAVLAEIGAGEATAGGAAGRGTGGGRPGGRGPSGGGDDTDRRSPVWRGAGAPGSRGDDGPAMGGGSELGDPGDYGASGGSASFGGKEQDPSQVRAAMAARMADGWQRLLISDSGREVEIVDAGDLTRAYVLDGKWHDRQAGHGSTKINARWQNDAIIVMIQQKGRFGMTQTYRLDPQERQLTVTLRLEPPSGADRLVTLVYGAPQ